MNESDELNEEDSNDEEFAQLLRQQLVSLTPLSSSLAQQQAGETLVNFGAGRSKLWLNARSIRMLSLHESQMLDTETMRTHASGLFAVMVDELPVTEPLPAEQAEQVLDEVADALNRILQPPQR